MGSEAVTSSYILRVRSSEDSPGLSTKVAFAILLASFPAIAIMSSSSSPQSVPP